ncbi:MAG TPA: monovalent cation:proton antiporter-2 (CPA2) family protein [Burkholderiales bacterium]|jgi:monovalent cation:proton antiporter-2 (CPA2) family protein|nr:monovalent cation:proton antiporter-2 (CPA2) family protein [Burkholderiales bacterium]
MQDVGFLHQSLIYLAAGVIVVPVFRRLGLGSVLGYLAAGVAIGPWGMRLVSAPEAILHFAEIGVVMLLFLVGLELNPRQLWQMRRPILGMGATQVALTALAVSAAGWALGLPWTVAVVAGMGFAMSSTAIGLATLQEKRLLQTAGGQASFSVLLFQDIAVIPLLLILNFLSTDGKTEFDWLAPAKAIGIIAAVIVGGRLLLRPLLRYIANTGLREIFVGFALLLVMGIAALMEAFGLSAALGAFLAGVLLADSEYRHALELDIDPFKGLLLGLFFIAVGMSVDLGLFLRSPLLVLGIACSVVILKTLLLYPIAQTFGYCGRQDATVFALSLSQVGEFAFVLFGAAGKVVPRETIDVLNASVAASMLSTPLLMMAYEKWLAPRLGRAGERAPDTIEEQNPVIVAGFGRFGQVVTRVLNGLKIGATVIDRDPNQVDLVRRFGSKAYYGDASNLQLLAQAGAERARLLVIALDDYERSMQMVKRVRRRFPGLKVIVRAHSRSDAFEYHEMGVPAVRETFGSALIAAEAALRALDFGPILARRAVGQFRRHDEETLAEQAEHRDDIKKLITLSQRGRQDLEKLLTGEVAAARRSL